MIEFEDGQVTGDQGPPPLFAIADEVGSSLGSHRLFHERPLRAGSGHSRKVKYFAWPRIVVHRLTAP